MFFDVELQPGGRRFEVRHGESILQGGLRAGVNLRYHCSNGTCGECRARLLAGTTERLQPSDFAFGAAEQSQGWLLLCSHTACSDLTVEAREIGAASDIAHQQLEARVTGVDLLDPCHAVVNLRTPRSRHLQFLAGQQVEATFAGVAPRRIALANCPCDGMRLQFHVRRVAGDALAEFVFGRLRRGETCVLQGPFGDFVLDERAPCPLLFIAYETGFAPVESLLEHAIALDWPAALRVLWLADDAAGLYRLNYCRSLQDALDDFRFHTAQIGAAEHFCEALSDLLPRAADVPGQAVYVVPPPGQVDALTAVLAKAGFAAVRVCELPAL